MRVLVVEDDRRIAADVAHALQVAGYLVETVRDGDEAWFRGDTEDYGAIILDLGLPGILVGLRQHEAGLHAVDYLMLTRLKKGQRLRQHLAASLRQ